LPQFILKSPPPPFARYTFGSPALIPRWRKDMEEVHRTRRRIDFVFADPATAERSMSARVVTDDSSVGLWSDHYPVVVTFAP
jgi:endonuclease/exonuclease/phosphatase family metal-dependent hydrolase